MDSRHDSLAVVRRWIDAFNRGDWKGFQELLAPEAVFTMTSDSFVLRGVDEVMESYRGWRGLFSALSGEVADGFGCGNRVAAQMMWTGVTAHEGRQIRFPACFLFTLRDDRLAEIVDYFDQVTYRTQMGEPLTR